MHIDSDTIVTRDISGFYDKCTTILCPIQSTPLRYFQAAYCFDKKYCGISTGGISGGVIFFRINELNQSDIDDTYKRLSDDLKKEISLEKADNVIVNYCLSERNNGTSLDGLYEKIKDASNAEVMTAVHKIINGCKELGKNYDLLENVRF